MPVAREKNNARLLIERTQFIVNRHTRGAKLPRRNAILAKSLQIS